MEQEIEESIISLSKRARSGVKATDAMACSQAVLNLANALDKLRDLKKI